MRITSRLRFFTIAAATLTGLVALNPAQAQTTTGSTQSPAQTTQPGATITPGSINTPGSISTPGSINTPGSTITPGSTAPGTTIQPGTGSGLTTPGATTPSTSTTPAARPAPQASTANQGVTSLLQQASSAGTFNTLARAVQAAGVANAIPSTGGQFTIFAPTDEAFAALPAGMLEKLLQPQNQALLRQVLAYHVVPGEVTSQELRTGVINTLGGGIAVRVSDGRIIVNDGSVVQPDIQASNGVIHVVNRVLLPEELRQQLTSLQ